jgi:WD40 repeat protein
VTRRVLHFSIPLLFLLPLNLTAAEDAQIFFSSQIAPILLAKCTSCHGSEKSKGGFRANTFQQFITPGKSKNPSVKPGEPESSEVYRRLVAKDEDDRMPQKDDPLSPDQIALFKQWILNGAKLDHGSPTNSLNELIPRQPYPSPPLVYNRPVPITALAFTSKGTELFASGYHEITTWNTAGVPGLRITNIFQRIHSIVFHPSEEFFIAAGGQPGREGCVQIFSNTGQPQEVLLRASDEVLCLAFDPLGKKFAAGGSDNSIHIFDWASRKEIITIQQHADWVCGLDFNVDGKKIASASRDRTARIYSASTGELESTYTGHANAVTSVAFLENGEIATGGKEKEVHLWKVEDARKIREIAGFNGEITALVAGRTNIFAACSDGVIRQFSSDQGKLVRKFASANDALFSLALHQPTQQLAAGSYDGSVRIWDLHDGTLKASFIAAPGIQTPK